MKGFEIRDLFKLHERIGNRHRHHGIVGKFTPIRKQFKRFGFDSVELIHRANDISENRADYFLLPPLLSLSSFLRQQALSKDPPCLTAKIASLIASYVISTPLASWR